MKTNSSLAISVPIAVLLALGMLPVAAQAIQIQLPEVDIQIGPEGNPWTVTQTDLANASSSVLQNADGSVSFLNGSISNPGSWVWSWTNLTVDADPAVSSVFGFTNTSAVTQTFIVTIDLPVAPILGSSMMGGSMGGSVTDANADGLGGVGTSAPTALYDARIDGVNLGPVAQLHPDPYSTPAFMFPGDTQNIAAVTFGLPGFTVPGPAVGSSIGIQNKFTLSPGDITSMTNVFIVQPVPEPSSVVLALLGGVALVGLALRRRRRQ